MIRIRFHGRGGQGTKTASRIVGTAAFLAGHQAQDSPVYGAERRGAAVVAYTRIADGPVLERGVIENPDFIVLADDSLLDSSEAQILSGVETASGLFVNTLDASRLVESYRITVPVQAYDLTETTLKNIGSASALSAGMGAAAIGMIGMSREHMIAALEEEFAALNIPGELIAKNITIAKEVFAAVSPMTIRIDTNSTRRRRDVVKLGYHDPLRGTPSVLNPGNAVLRNTGAWRVERPVIDAAACTCCGLCFVLCPDGAISLDSEGFPVVDYDHCKGCMICRHLCPIQAIQLERETKAW